MKPLPQYRSHKIVSGLKIKKIELNNFKGAELSFKDQGYPNIQVSPAYMEKHRPESGGYYVIYENGYLSWSPGDVFENGYTLIP